MTTVTAIIQARVGSTRLPGKVMYPLDGKPVLQHVIDRVLHTDSITDVVVATSSEPQDDVIEQYVSKFGVGLIRGSESDVLSRFEQVLEQCNPEIIVRVTADCPLISPQFIQAGIQYIKENNIDYVSAGLDRTFPRGLTCEMFTTGSFKRVCVESSEPHHHEHVTPYYREHPERFDLASLNSSTVFEEPWLQDRTDLRLTLDEPADYQLLEVVYREVDYNGILGVRDAVKHIDDSGLVTINQEVKQKSIK